VSLAFAIGMATKVGLLAVALLVRIRSITPKADVRDAL
jgi:hypothetical protein